MPADVHFDIVCRTGENDPELDLKGLLEALGDDRSKLASAVSTNFTGEHTTVFPLINALAMGETDVDGANVKRKVSAWAGRALLEAGLSRMCGMGAAKL